jgi:hypothetical protein
MFFRPWPILLLAILFPPTMWLAIALIVATVAIVAINAKRRSLPF